MEELVTELAALREIVVARNSEIEMLKLRLTEEAQCATFLASPTGKTLVRRLADLNALHDAVCALLSAPPSTAPAVLSEALRLRLGSKST